MKNLIFAFTLFLWIGNLSAQDQNLLSSKYSVQELQNRLIPQNDWKPFPRLDDRAGWAKADKAYMQAYIKAAEGYLDYDWPTLPATLSLLIVRTGNRSEYEAITFKRRTVLFTLMMAEIAENKGRFIDPIINGVWAICEESWWGVPAHLPKSKDISGLMDVYNPFVELFSAETGALLAWTDYFFGEKFDAVSPQIRKRIYNEVNYRLMEPLEKNHQGWMSTYSNNGRPPSNWNPWITSNWITFVLLLEKDNVRRTSMTAKALGVLDEFLNPYPDDGGCDEGPSYWGAAAASLYDNVVILNLASNDAFKYVFADEKFKNMGRFIYRFQISDPYFINFSDAGPKLGIGSSTVYRYGKDIQDQSMMDLGAYYRRKSGSNILGGRTHLSRSFFELFLQDELQNAPQRLPLPKDVWMPGLQVAIARDTEGSSNGFFFAAKGGSNDENHNHNDIGNYVVYYDGKPLLIDVGSGKYTLRTFDDNQRYDIWFNSSDNHNTPTINSVTQRNGIDYKATDVSYKQSKSSTEFSLNMAGAYPKEAGVNYWQRTIKLNRGKGIRITDVTDLQKATAVREHLMTCYPAEVSKPGEVIIHYQPTDGKALDFVIKYNPQQMKAEVEKIKFVTEEDQGVLQKWGDVIRRINFDVINPKIKDRYTFEIKKK
ncbi:MAG: heparinase II/III-family protein [Tannerellaceae bacterium]|jgi:hypothetical protein|nr:heparinase II/III-family protein [Tannerellaceae bacterium]